MVDEVPLTAERCVVDTSTGFMILFKEKKREAIYGTLVKEREDQTCLVQIDDRVQDKILAHDFTSSASCVRNTLVRELSSYKVKYHRTCIITCSKSILECILHPKLKSDDVGHT